MNPCVAILGGFFPPPCGVLRRRINMINMIKKYLKSIFRKILSKKHRGPVVRAGGGGGGGEKSIIFICFVRCGVPHIKSGYADRKP
jgi:hypothetical protein